MFFIGTNKSASLRLQFTVSLVSGLPTKVLLFVATQVSVTAASDISFKGESAMSTSTQRCIL